MFKFFRKFRQDLLSGGKVGKYMSYAIGEIILVVLGILIALQLNNWNESRKNDHQFKAILEQIYTVIDQDMDRLDNIRNALIQQLEIIELIQDQPDEINSKLLPHLLYYVDLEHEGIHSEVNYHLGFLNFDPEDEEQSSLNKNLNSYANKIRVEFFLSRSYITPILEQAQIPNPSLVFGYSALNNYQNIDYAFFNQKDILKSKDLLAQEQLQNALKSKWNLIGSNLMIIANLIDQAKTSKSFIKSYYPEIKLLYNEIGIVGSGTEVSDWNKNIPLAFTNQSRSIWEADIILKEGYVKFREGDNWNFNWGGASFPQGESLSYGDDIKVVPGSYHVVLNLEEKTYKFIKQ